MDDFITAYEQLVAQIEDVVAQYPVAMREQLREHARAVIDTELRARWYASQAVGSMPSLSLDDILGRPSLN